MTQTTQIQHTLMCNNTPKVTISNHQKVSKHNARLQKNGKQKLPKCSVLSLLISSSPFVRGWFAELAVNLNEKLSMLQLICTKPSCHQQTFHNHYLNAYSTAYLIYRFFCFSLPPQQTLSFRGIASSHSRLQK